VLRGMEIAVLDAAESEAAVYRDENP